MPKIVDHETRRRELIEASWKVIAAEGLEGVTMRKIATEAGCTTGRLTHYFADREALILAALQVSNKATSNRVNDIIASNATAYDKLLQMAEQTLPLDEDRRTEVKIWLAFWSAATIDHSLAKENDARMNEWFSALIPLLKEVAPKANADHEANLLIGLVNGLGIQIAVNPTKTNLERALSVVHTHLEQLVA
jgi:AcrR family transcriptional regulator